MPKMTAQKLEARIKQVVAWWGGFCVGGIAYQILSMIVIFISVAATGGFEEGSDPNAYKWVDRLVLWVVLPLLSIIVGWISGRYIWKRVESAPWGMIAHAWVNYRDRKNQQ